jgi:hypothetical protein
MMHSKQDHPNMRESQNPASDANAVEVLPSGLVLTHPADIEELRLLRLHFKATSAIIPHMEALLDGVGEEAARTALAGEKPVEELRARLADAELRAASVEARVEGLGAVRAKLDRMAALSRRAQREQWVAFSKLIKLVPKELVSRNTVESWCSKDGPVRARQPGGVSTPIEVELDSFWDEIELYARRKGKLEFLDRLRELRELSRHRIL